ncbi:hypothetical protein TNCV_4792211 [Trichonephila clavipes]|nr:hypothetical protein TNCV_4792211 [Trichonephila clavipes]
MDITSPHYSPASDPASRSKNDTIFVKNPEGSDLAKNDRQVASLVTKVANLVTKVTNLVAKNDANLALSPSSH